MGHLDVYAMARAMVRATHAGDVSARELLEVHLARIDEVNPSVSAVTSLDAERARQAASAADRHRNEPGEQPVEDQVTGLRGQVPGVLDGLCGEDA